MSDPKPVFYFATRARFRTHSASPLGLLVCQGELLATYSEDNVHLFDPAACQRALSDVYCQQIAKYRDALASLQVGHLFKSITWWWMDLVLGAHMLFL